MKKGVFQAKRPASARWREREELWTGKWGHWGPIFWGTKDRQVWGNVTLVWNLVGRRGLGEATRERHLGGLMWGVGL